MLRIFSALILLLAFSCAQGQSFQGTLRLESTADGQTTYTTWKLKNGNHRMDIRQVADGSEHQYALVMEKASPFVKLLATNEQGDFFYDLPRNSMQKTMADFSSATVSETGQSRLVAGLQCKQYNLDNGMMRASVWIGSPDGLTDADLPEMMRSNGIIATLRTNGISGLPLEQRIYDNEGAELSSQTFIGIEAGDVSEREFVIPSNYKKGH